ncbi:MAG: hypothetical protein ABSE04_03195 [Candidatus Microgenomates bacterium]|jgi:hypothetical protein
MKKLLIIGVAIVVVIIIVIVLALKTLGGGSSSPSGTQVENVPELPQSEWPIMTLIPTSNPQVNGSLGHWLDFKVQKINVPQAASMDYLMIYNTTDGGQQGVPGTVKLTGTDIDKQLLLGSESSGKYRYDDGVETGSMTITFRDANGKSVGKLSADFHLQSGTATLTSVDGKFTYSLNVVPKNVYFVTMSTFVQPDPSAYVVWQNGYGVFASDGKPHPGKLGQ